MKSSIKIEFPDELKKDMQSFGNEIAKNIAIFTREELTKEYGIAVEEFYNAYTPKQYERKWQLRKSYRPYYRNPHGTRFHGGVEITIDKMKDVHDADNIIILSNALSGYHGPENLGIYTPPWIFEHVINYRDLLFGMIDFIAEDAIKKAKKQKYSILEF